MCKAWTNLAIWTDKVIFEIIFFGEKVERGLNPLLHREQNVIMLSSFGVPDQHVYC